MRNYWQTPQGAAQGGQRQPAARGDAPAAAGARGALGDGERELPVGPAESASGRSPALTPLTSDDARPRSDRLRCGGRESKFLAVG